MDLAPLNGGKVNVSNIMHNILTHSYPFIRVYVLPKVEFKSMIALFG